MKKINKLRLNVLNEQSLEEKQINDLRSGSIRYSCFGFVSIKSKNMRHLTLVLLFLLATVSLVGQTKKLYSEIWPPSYREITKFTVVDSGDICVWYTMNADENHPNKNEPYDDLQILEIGSNFSKYYSSIVFISDSVTENWYIKHPKVKAGPWGTIGENRYLYWSECFKELTNNKLTEYVRMPRYIQNHFYSEDIPVQEWLIQDDTLTIANYLNQKATCNYRGRNYTAWFAPDIPISNGPWKFGGLPGLIMKVYDDDREFVFECVGIYNKKFKIKKFDYTKYLKMSREKILTLMKRIDENFYAAAGMTIENSTSSHPGKIEKKPIYNTMLLELE
jgi:GLPGLI family protein